MVGVIQGNVRSAKIRKIVLDKRTDSRPVLIIQPCGAILSLLCDEPRCGKCRCTVLV